MDISPKSIPPLARFITGDIEQTPYLTGTKLIDLFNQFGFCDNYDTDFPSRWKYVEEKLEIINNTDHLSSVLEYLLDNEPAFKIEYTNRGNPKPESYDRADAIIVAKAGYKLQQNL